MATKKCEICNKEFQPKRSNQKLCGSEQCKKQKKQIYAKWYNDNRYSKSKEMKCVICGELFIPRRAGQKTCKNNRCKSIYQQMKREEYACRPFSFDTDMMLVIDLQKGWPLEKVAKVAAECFNRDYNHVLNHIQKLKGSTREKQILQIIKTNRLYPARGGY